MNLQPVKNQPGLWQNQDWSPSTPGTFVVLVGVSAYDFLPGGTGKPLATTSYGLGQLAVSAWTAYALFEWFSSQYQYSAASPVPVAQVWLLLAPTADELARITAKDPRVTGHLLPPTFANCEDAVSLWHQTMEKLPKVVAEQSRAYFFFSGHGLEIISDEQILLPSDYLKRPNLLNRAINVRKMAKAMKTMKLLDKFFFIDACRDDNDRLRVKQIEGSGILDIDQAFMVNRANNGLLLYATTSGQSAHQPASPQNYSLFGQALLEGLTGRAAVPNCQTPACPVEFRGLQEFVNDRYNELLTLADEPGPQFVRPGGDGWNQKVAVTQWLRVPVAPMSAPPTVMEQQTNRFTQRTNVSLATEPAAASTPRIGGPMFRLENVNTNILESLSGKTVPESTTIEPEPLSEPTFTNNLHDILGRESVTELWEKARVYSLETRKWLPRKKLLLHRVERTDGNVGYRLTFSLDAPTGRHWLQLSDGTTTFGIALPGAKSLMPNPDSSQLRYRLDFTVLDQANAHTRVTTMRADLATDNPGLTGIAAGLWDKYQTVNAETAAEATDMQQLRNAFQDSGQVPIAGAIGALILLRARQLDLFKGYWLTNLANWFPNLPDGLPLRNQWLLLQPDAAITEPEIADNLQTLQTRGLPYIGEVLGLAMRQVEAVLEATNAGPMPNPALVADLTPLKVQLRLALRYFRPGGLLAVFAGPKRAISPKALGYELA